MKEDGIVMQRGASAELSKRLYKGGILKYNNIDYDAQNKERDNVRNRIDEHRKTDSAENISGHWFKIYCDYFYCSADYLFGYIELPTHEKTNIKNHTGLSKNAIDKLINLYNTANNNEDVFGSSLTIFLDFRTFPALKSVKALHRLKYNYHNKSFIYQYL